MAEEEELYIRLFHPLNDKPKKEIWKIWENSINKDIYLRTKEIEQYCKENDCDFLMAICYIYEIVKYLFTFKYVKEDGNIESKYFSYNTPGYNDLESFLKKRIIDCLNLGGSITEEQVVTLYKMIDIIIYERIYCYKYSDVLSDFLNKLGISSYNLNIEEEKDLRNIIEALSLERQNNPDIYINEILKIKVRKKDFEENIQYLGHTKEMYYPVSKIKTENNIKDFNQEKTITESREILITNFSSIEINRIFNELVNQKYIDDNLDLFLSCFGFSEDKEGKIVWKSTKVEFEIFISEIVEKEENPVNKAMCLPRKKINNWFMDQNSNSIEAVRNINCDEKSYPIYKIIHP
ncbi:MAG: hypothetical protein H6Q16_2109 [Bacteroidetes bacterium]|nr:hypothetical protein [Bacteroidota bacterium]